VRLRTALQGHTPAFPSVIASIHFVGFNPDQRKHDKNRDTPYGQPPTIARRQRAKATVADEVDDQSATGHRHRGGAGDAATGRLAGHALLVSAESNAQGLGMLANEKARRILSPAEATLRQLTYTPISRASRLNEQLAFMPIFADVLTHNPLVSAIYIGYRNGSFLLLRPLDTPAARQQFNAPDKATFLVQVVDRTQPSARAVGSWYFFNADFKRLSVERRADYQFDPRTRPWFGKALEVGGQHLTDPYVFFSTQQVGLTLSELTRDGQAVIGMDVALSDLGVEMGALKMTPRSEIAVVDTQGRVVAYTDEARTLLNDGKSVGFKMLEQLGVPALTSLDAASKAHPGKAVSFASGGENWFGVRVPMEELTGGKLSILIAMPDSDLLAELKQSLKGQGLLAGAVLAMLLPLGWLAGAQISKSLQLLAQRGRHLSRFRFLPDAAAAQHHLSEVGELHGVLDNLSLTIQNFLAMTEAMSREPQMDRMLDAVLNRLVAATGCAQGAVYLVSDNPGTATHQGKHLVLTTQVMLSDWGPRAKALPESCSLNRADWLQALSAGLSDTGDTQLVLNLTSRQNELLGLLVLRYPADDYHVGHDFQSFAEKLSGALAVAIETRKLIDGQKALFDAVIQLMADAIDAKSPYTGGHCERVPELAEMLIRRLSEQTEGPYADYRLSDDQRYEFRLGAWLHDCGKVTSPEHIVDKATKLEVIYNRIHEVRLRFEVLHRDAQLVYWQGLTQPGAVESELRASRDQLIAALHEEFAFVARCNIGGEFMSEADITRLKAVAERRWLRHFDNRLGLSAEELLRVGGIPPADLPAVEPLLSDRPEHLVPWGSRRPPVETSNPENIWGFNMKLPAHAQNMGELTNLTIRRGTLTDEDRFKINDHIVQTLIMLRSLPWPAHLAKVPDIATNHHEKLDGKGYPRGLDDTVLTVEDRVMALADIFEALTAADRPYKAAKTLSESLKIMAFMAKDRHICPEMFRFFLHSRLWREFAERFLRPSQIDEVDIGAIEQLLARPAGVSR
jgi:HD-GYP domain-containing protein (c-di-GMP phosphodiesterase class II)